MFNCNPLALRSAEPVGRGRTGASGVTLAELLVVLVILSILAVTAVPMAEATVERNKELALRQTLREVRTAIDSFHDDWASGIMSSADRSASKNGYPKSLDALVEGVKLVEGPSSARRYLRDLPVNPFMRDAGIGDQWRLIGYDDAPDAESWGGEDIYDLRAITEKKGLDGTPISQW